MQRCDLSSPARNCANTQFTMRPAIRSFAHKSFHLLVRCLFVANGAIRSKRIIIAIRLFFHFKLYFSVPQQLSPFVDVPCHCPDQIELTEWPCQRWCCDHFQILDKTRERTNEYSSADYLSAFLCTACSVQWILKAYSMLFITWQLLMGNLIFLLERTTLSRMRVSGINAKWATRYVERDFMKWRRNRGICQFCCWCGKACLQWRICDVDEREKFNI